MNYLLKSKPKNENRKKIIFVLALYVFLSIFGFLFGNIWRSGLWAIAKPLWKAESFIYNPVARIGDYFSFKNTLINQNLALQAENADLKVKELDYDALMKENSDLKNQLGYTNNSQRISAGILVRPPVSPYDTILVDAGSAEGVVKGDEVYIGENIIIGLITSTSAHTSLVNLFSSSGVKQSAVLSRTGESFELIGKGGQNFQLEVPKETDILWGDVFVYPGLSKSEIATVDYIDSDSQSSFKTIYLHFPTNAFASKYIFIQKSL